jgi:hypothetical protein
MGSSLFYVADQHRDSGSVLPTPAGLSWPSTSAVSAASFKNGRPDRPPLIWKWLSNAFGAEEDVIERVDIVEDTVTNSTYMEELADAGFNMTGVYLSPDSVLNPMKWADLLQGVLPKPKEVRVGRDK